MVSARQRLRLPSLTRFLPLNVFKTGKNLSKNLSDVLSLPGPVICEVMCNPDQKIIPAVKNEDGSMTSQPLEDMYPFLDRIEFLTEMVIKPVEQKALISQEQNTRAKSYHEIY